MAHRIRIRISDGVSVDTGQPTREELERLAQEGFKAVVNLRTADEPNQPLSPEAEGEVARKAGLDGFVSTRAKLGVARRRTSSSYAALRIASTAVARRR